MSRLEACQVCGCKFAKLNPRFGSEPLWMDKAMRSIIGDESWHIVILVGYPTRAHFIKMLADPDYPARAPIRAAGLEDSHLVETEQLMGLS